MNMQYISETINDIIRLIRLIFRYPIIIVLIEFKIFVNMAERESISRFILREIFPIGSNAERKEVLITSESKEVKVSRTEKGRFLASRD